MNNDFKSEEFEELLLKEAEKFGIYQEAHDELELYRTNNQIEYLFWVYKFVEAIKENVFKYPILRMAGATSVCAYILGIHMVNPIKYELSNKFFFQRHYKYNLSPRFDITIPKSQMEEAIKTLNKLTNNTVEFFIGGLYRFGDKKQFTIGLYGSNFLERCLQSLNIVKSYQYDYECYEDDPEFINYILEEDHKGFCLPNLAGCVPVALSKLYEYMDAAKPNNLDDLAKLISLGESVFKNEKYVVECLRCYGLEDTICSREQALNVLSRYDVDEDRALVILDTIMAGDALFESDILLLESNEVPSFIIEQLENIRYLSHLSFAIQETKIIYKIVTGKKWFIDDFEKILPNPYPHSFVGPFFYIGGRLFSHRDQLTNFDKLTRFFNDPVSHFDYFNMLGIDGDYDNYPRGRVIYDNFHRKFIVYLDKALEKKDIKESIKLTYCLEEGRTVFKRDSHYTHDGL